MRTLWTHILRKRRLSLLVGVFAGAFLMFAWIYLQNDIHRNYLDPKIPFQVYQPPKPADYASRSGWYLNPALAGYYSDPRRVDVFFIHGTTFDGGKDWLGRIDSRSVTEDVFRVQLPNYAAPYGILGNVYAPRYRQASLYTLLTLREDAREARQYAYRDIENAFRMFLKQRRGGDGFVVVGVEQGGVLAERLLRDIVAADPELKNELVVAYLLETLAPERQFGASGRVFPACMSRQQTGCVISYLSAEAGRPDQALQKRQKAVFWEGNALVPFNSQKAVCVNPIVGAATGEASEERLSLGATNATGLEWGTEPALLPRQVSARCVGGLLFVDKPGSPSFRNAGTWEDKRKVRSYNLFYGDLQADLELRWNLFRAR